MGKRVLLALVTHLRLEMGLIIADEEVARRECREAITR
jgi:hypothetical protein